MPCVPPTKTWRKKNEIILQERETIEQIVLRMRHESQFYTQGLRYLVSPVEKTNRDLLLSRLTSSGLEAYGGREMADDVTLVEMQV